MMMVIAAASALACGEALEFPEWTMPVPPGTRIVEHANVPAETRTERLEVVEDEIALDATMYAATAMAVDVRGRFYVLARGDNRVLAFESDGRLRFTAGREGQGPGELQVPTQIAISGERIVVSDLANGRLTLWDLDGGHVDDAPFSSARLRSIGLAGSDAGGVLSVSLGRSADGGAIEVVSRLSHQAEETVRFAELPRGDNVAWRGGTPPGNPSYFEGAVEGSGSRTRVMPVWAVDRTGGVYVSRADQYQVMKLSEDGGAAWAMRVATDAPPFPDAEVDAILARLGERFPGLRASQFDWPERLPAIADLRVDGHGHLFVFPLEYRLLDGDEVAVDVYDREGARLFSGLMRSEDARWSTALGDHVFRLGGDPDTEEAAVYRRRIIEPWAGRD